MSGTIITSEHVQRYEGLVLRTASMLDGKIEMEFDDIAQTLRIKVWRALEAYDPTRSNLAEGRFVFGAIINLKKDLYNKKRHGLLHIEDLAPVQGSDDGSPGRDKFEHRYLCVREDEVFGLIEDDGVLIPSTLTDVERRVVCLLYADYRQTEIAKSLGLGRKAMERAMKAIRLKMADWCPTPAPDPKAEDGLSVA